MAHTCTRVVGLGGHGPSICFYGAGSVALGDSRRASADGCRGDTWSGLCDLVAAALACRHPGADNLRFQWTAPRCGNSLYDASPRLDGQVTGFMSRCIAEDLPCAGVYSMPGT